VFRSDLAGMPFLAHPRIEPDGRIWNLGLAGKAAFVWRLSAAGALEAGQAISLPMGSYIHDFTATARHLVIVLQPWVHDHMALPFVESLSWKPELGSKVLVVDKDDLSRRRLYELPPFAFFHLGDAWEEKDGTIRFDGCFEADPGFGRDAARALVEGRYIPVASPQLTMVALRPDGRADMRAAGIDAEFPRSEPQLAGLPRSRTVHVGGYLPGRPFASKVGVWDWRTGKDDVHDFGARQLVEEFVPVSNGKRPLLMGTTINLDTRRSELHVFDARRVATGPIASWAADTALPVSFHGNWVDA
jgi:carotenoid cleavage dioxygenase-like enzyme